MLKIGKSFFRKLRAFNNKKFNKQCFNTGMYAESIAAKYLKKHRLIILEQNFLCKLGEIDIICLDKETVVFIEVRYRSHAQHGSAVESINYPKQQKIVKTAKYWTIQQQSQHFNIRFDAILFDKGIDYEHLTWLKAVF